MINKHHDSILSWISVDDHLPEVGVHWNGEDWVLMRFEPRQHSEVVPDSQQLEVSTSMWLHNLMKHPEDTDGTPRRQPTHWARVRLPEF